MRGILPSVNKANGVVSNDLAQDKANGRRGDAQKRHSNQEPGVVMCLSLREVR